MHGLHGLEAQRISALLRGRLSVDTHDIFRARRSHEAPEVLKSLVVPSDVHNETHERGKSTTMFRRYPAPQVSMHVIQVT